MANIVTVREFMTAYRDSKPGTQLVVVNGAKRRIVAAVTVDNVPEQIEKNIKVIYTR